MSGLIDQFRASAARWHVSVGMATVLNLVALIGVPVLAAVFVAHRPTFRHLLNEDGVAEWGQVLFFAGTGVVAALVAMNRYRRRLKGQGVLWTGLAIAMLVIVGEEIAWGQRILGLETPEILERINNQDEITVHNIGRVLTIFNLVLFVASVYAILAEWIQRRWNIAGRFRDGDRLYVPPFFLAGLFAVMVAYRFTRSILLTQESYALTSLSEWAELCFAFALFLTVFLSYRWVTRRSTEG